MSKSAAKEAPRSRDTYIGLSMLAVVLWANLVGSILPIILFKLKLDPAVISSPLVTTMVDVTGLVIYFSIAKAVISLLLTGK